MATAANSPSSGDSSGSELREGCEIVCVGFAEWATELWTNQHHLMSRLAGSHKILFVESLGLRRPQLVSRDVRRLGRRVIRGARPPQKQDGVWVLAPLVVPLHGRRVIRWLNKRLLRFQVRRALRRLGFTRPILWAYVPQAQWIASVADFRFVLYHCVDDMAANKGTDARSFRAMEEEFAQTADLVVASSRPLAERLSDGCARVRYMPNVADVGAFREAFLGHHLDPAMAAIRAPRFVFAGALTAAKVDFELLTKVAELRPAYSFVLVGPVGLGDPATDIRGLLERPNVYHLGMRPHNELPGIFTDASAGLIPYKLTQLTASIFPMKVYEYLAAGLPVVATDLGSLAEVDEVVRTSDADTFATALDRVLEVGASDREALSASVVGHSWERRIEELERAIEETVCRRSRGP